MEVRRLTGHPILSRDYVLREGNKELRLRISPEAGLASTRIETIEGARRLKGSTTALYQRAREIIQEEADTLGKRIVYKFETEHPKMRAWALDPERGRGIFDWDRVYPLTVPFEATAFIEPNNMRTSPTKA